MNVDNMTNTTGNALSLADGFDGFMIAPLDGRIAIQA